VQGLLEFAKTLGAPRIAAMAAVTLALVGFFAFLILRVTAPQMSRFLPTCPTRTRRQS
jgi:flagellar M-ring protein FliF